MMDKSASRMKRQMIEALREENQSLVEQLSRLQSAEAVDIEQQVLTGAHAIRGLVKAVQALARVMPNTAAGRNAIEQARSLCEHHGVPLPSALKKVPKPRRRKKVRKARSSSRLAQVVS